MKKNKTVYKSTSDFAAKLGHSKAEIELINLKGAVIAQLDKDREHRKLNNTEFSNFLGIPKSRWSAIISSPDKVTLDYLITLASKCGAFFKLTKKAA